MSKLKWTKKPHPLWGEGGSEEIVNMFNDMSWPKYQWTAEKSSIIYPRPEISQKKHYELYDGEGIFIFDTLKEAKNQAELLNQSK